MNRNKPRKSLWELRPGDLPDERILRAEPRLRGLENNAAFRARRIHVPLRPGEPPTNVKTVLGLHYQVAFALAHAGLEPRDFVLAHWGALLAPGTMATIRRCTCFLFIYVVVGMFLGPADIELMGRVKSPADALAFRQMRAAAVCGAALFGYFRAFWVGGAPWSALITLTKVETDFNPKHYPKGAGVGLSRSLRFAAALCLFICAGFPTGLSIVAGLLVPAFCIWEGILSKNWAWNNAGSLSTTVAAVVAMLLGWGIGTAHAAYARWRGPRTVELLIQRAEEIMRPLQEEEDWKRASRRLG